MNIIPILADLTMSNSGGLGQALCWLVVAILVLAFLCWVVKNYISEPMQKWAWLVIALFCLLVLINIVMSFNGHGFIHW
jgi:uncharacterized protein YggT (Ycf19 family)